MQCYICLYLTYLIYLQDILKFSQLCEVLHQTPLNGTRKYYLFSPDQTMHRIEFLRMAKNPFWPLSFKPSCIGVGSYGNGQYNTTINPIRPATLQIFLQRTILPKKYVGDKISAYFELLELLCIRRSHSALNILKKVQSFGNYMH